MKIFTGKELFDAHSGIAKSLADLDHIAKGEVPCTRCGGTGWCPPSVPNAVMAWLRAFPLRIKKRSRRFDA